MIAIDPGPEQSAWVRYVNGEILEMDIEPNEHVRTWLPHASSSTLAIEMVASYGMAVGKDVFETVYWIGRFDEAHNEGSAIRIYRKDVKVHLCGNVTAKDSNIRQALIDRFGGTGGKDAAVGKKASPGPLYGIRKDLWSALAVAVTY
ncbi:MAG TPA: hypothetical protein VKA50_10160, partial [Gammaproteobacteria bacterium]|nr:hypothetical protein [Gammaproteobacteria bacterium]